MAQNTTKTGSVIQCDEGALWTCVEVGKLLTSAKDRGEILSIIIERVSQLIEADNWSLLLLTQGGSRLRFEIVVGDSCEQLKGVTIDSTKGVAGHVAQTGEPLIIRDVQKDPRFNPQMDKSTGFVTESIICLPMRIRDKVIGVVEIINVHDMEAFDARHLPILTILVDYAAIAIEKAHYIEKIARASITDEYTGLPNARYLHRIIGDVIQKAKTQNSGFAVVFVDIDNFKDIVDTYGHLSGSRILKEIGDVAVSCLDPGDMCIKYGGDEYVILFPGKTRDQAAKMCETILEKLKATNFLDMGEKSPQVTASFGIATFPQDADNKKDLLDLADKRMYRIKKRTKSGVGWK